MPGLTDYERNTAVFHAIFPNTFYFLFPAGLFVVRLCPVSPTETVEHAHLLVHPTLYDEVKTSEVEAKLDEVMAFYDKTNKEDIAACELVQSGIQTSAYQGGRVSYRFEET